MPKRTTAARYWRLTPTVRRRGKEAARAELADYESKLVKKIESSYLHRLGGLIIDQVSAGFLGVRYGRIMVDQSNKLPQSR